MNRTVAPCILFLVVVVLTCQCRARELDGSCAGDSLVFPNEIFIITKEELISYNVQTLEDIMLLLPGVVQWREGPPGSHSGFSIDGRSHYGITLLMNGEPIDDPYTVEPLMRVLPLSRIKRVEVIFSGSPRLTGSCSSNGAINLVIEEGGGEGPQSEVDFSNGRSNRRARRAWFSTPQAFMYGTVAYDEYLQDAVESYPEKPTRKLGDYDMRSVLLDLSIATGDQENVLVRMHRFEDTYVGTPYASYEDVRYDGYDAQVRYARGGFSIMLGRSSLSMSRLFGEISNLALYSTSRWAVTFGGVEIDAFVSAERVLFENTLRYVTVDTSVHFDPTYHRTEGGISAGGRVFSRIMWRAGVFGGSHSIVGRYLAGELGVAVGSRNGFSQSLMVSRRLRVPSIRELFQPVWEWVPGREGTATAGNGSLDPEITDEISLGMLFRQTFSIDLFTRREKSRIVLRGDDPSIYYSEGTGSVSGVRSRFSWRGNRLGFGFGINVGFEYFGKRSDWTPGIPEFRMMGGFSLRRRIFKETETVSLRWDSETVGERFWSDVEMGLYTVHHLSASISIMRARIAFQYKNIFDEQYETVPGFLMPERHYLIGIQWELFD